MRTPYTPVPSITPYFMSDKFQNFAVGPVGPTSGDTQYLTPDGWKDIAGYRKGEKIAVWSESTQRIHFEVPADYIVAKAETLIEFECSRVRMCLSGNHRFPYYDYRGLFQVTTAGHVAKVPSTRTIPRFIGHNGPSIMPDSLMRLAVCLHADGHFPPPYVPSGRKYTRSPDNTRVRKNCCVTIRKERKKTRLRWLLELNNIAYIERTSKARPTEAQFWFVSPYIGKRYTGVWWQANMRDCEIILDEMQHWDGLFEGSEQRFYSAYREDADFMQYVACAVGGGATIRAQVYPDNPEWKTTYTVYIAVKDSYKAANKIDGNHLSTRAVPALGGKQYCFETSTGFFIARYKDFVFVTGNSTKTTASIIKIAYEASRVAKARDGKRRSRYVIVRNTKQQLLDSTLKDWLKWFPDGVAGNFRKTEFTFDLKFNDVETEVMFRGLDDSGDVRRLLSLQLTGAFMDEFREINQEIFEALTGRLGRYPDGMLVPHRPEWGLDKKGKPIQGCVDDAGRSMARVWGSTNAPDMDTYWYEYLTNPPKDCSVTIQPGGLSQEADWTHLLDSEYYERLTQGKSQEWIDVYIHAKWGSSLSGKPVFRSFDPDLHIAKAPLRPIKSANHPLIIGMDFGLNPSAVICQVDALGRLLVFKAMTSDGMGVLRFIQTVLRPCMTAHYPGMSVIVVGDPAGVQRAQTDERSCFDILKREGFKAMPASTNALGARLAAVDTFLMRQVAGQTGVIIDPEATLLVRALRGGYRYKVKKSGEQEDAPEKNASSHLADSFQYACLHADGGLRGTLLTAARKEIVRASALGWT